MQRTCTGTHYLLSVRDFETRLLKGIGEPTGVPAPGNDPPAPHWVVHFEHGLQSDTTSRTPRTTPLPTMEGDPPPSLQEGGLLTMGAIFHGCESTEASEMSSFLRKRKVEKTVQEALLRGVDSSQTVPARTQEPCLRCLKGEKSHHPPTQPGRGQLHSTWGRKPRSGIALAHDEATSLDTPPLPPKAKKKRRHRRDAGDPPIQETTPAEYHGGLRRRALRPPP